ncbi:hypothetical protein N6H14_04675 [Paenibacillus sp. CC-CFT747]|nr:hypothetical protein N6H14_04675 [Paenibacillus sp. CC-CFT747]
MRDRAPRRVSFICRERKMAGRPPYSCPDFSMRFKTGEAYLFFLADVPPRLRLLEPQWRTASPVRNGQVMVRIPHGETATLEERLQSFAALRNVAVQTPDSGSPVWGGTIWGKLRWLATAAGAALAVLGLGALKRIGRR